MSPNKCQKEHKRYVCHVEGVFHSHIIPHHRARAGYWWLHSRVCCGRVSVYPHHELCAGRLCMAKKENRDEIEKIVVKGARTHNLKNVSVEMPRGKMIVFTGLSGSGKSSLAFDTIFAEGQRKYVESLSAYARQFLNKMQKPDVDEISGLSPAISIDQKSRSNNPRSTVATITEIYDYLRVLYARVGTPYCLACDHEVRKLSNEEILEQVLRMVDEARKGAKRRSWVQKFHKHR